MKKYFLVTILLLAFSLIAYIIAYLLGRSNESKCTSNLRMLSRAIQLYTADFDDTYPIRSAWEEYLPMKHPKIYCPDTRRQHHDVKVIGFYGYAINSGFLGVKRESFGSPRSTVMVFESAAGVLSGSAPNPFPGLNPDEIKTEKGWLRHRGGSNYLFADGHVSWYLAEEVHGMDDHDGNDGLHPTFNLSIGTKQLRANVRQ